MASTTPTAIDLLSAATAASLCVKRRFLSGKTINGDLIIADGVSSEST